jgi:hypothetical protein
MLDSQPPPTCANGPISYKTTNFKLAVQTDPKPLIKSMTRAGRKRSSHKRHTAPSGTNAFSIAYIAFSMSWVFFFIVSPFDIPITQALASLTIGLVGSIPMISAVVNPSRRGPPMFEFHLFFLSVAFGFSGLGPYYMGRVGYTEAAIWGAWGAYLIYACSASIVYYWNSGRRLQANASVVKVSDAWAWVVVVAAVLSQAVLSSGLLSESTSQTFLVLDRFITAAVIFSAVERRKSWFIRCVCLAIIALKIGLIILTGLLAGVASLGGALVCAWIWAQRRSHVAIRAGIPAVLASCGIAFIVIANPIKITYRTLAWDGEERSMREQISAMLISVDYMSDVLGSKEYFKESIADVCERFCATPLLAGAITRTPSSIPYKHGETLMPLVTKLIPRALWRNKPVENLGNEWGREYGFLEASDFTTSLNLPMVVEAYINGGFFGVVLVGVLVGLGFRRAASWFMSKGDSFMTRTLFVGVLYPFLFPESNLSILFGGVIIAGVIGYVFLRMMSYFEFPNRTIYKNV